MSKNPVRLAKKTENHADEIILTIYYSFINRVEAWVLSHAMLCLIVTICFLIALFTVVIFLMVGISATESGVMRNFVNGGLV